MGITHIKPHKPLSFAPPHADGDCGHFTCTEREQWLSACLPEAGNHIIRHLTDWGIKRYRGCLWCKGTFSPCPESCIFKEAELFKRLCDFNLWCITFQYILSYILKFISRSLHTFPPIFNIYSAICLICFTEQDLAGSSVKIKHLWWVAFILQRTTPTTKNKVYAAYSRTYLDSKWQKKLRGNICLSVLGQDVHAYLGEGMWRRKNNWNIEEREFHCFWYGGRTFVNMVSPLPPAYGDGVLLGLNHTPLCVAWDKVIWSRSTKNIFPQMCRCIVCLSWNRLKSFILSPMFYSPLPWRRGFMNGLGAWTLYQGCLGLNY